jgi:hypothetical protein
MKNHKTETNAATLTIDLKPTGARVGKIARLPSIIREQLNNRLFNGALGKEIISWLNASPEVTRIMAEQFAGKPISENNLSEWRRGGYQDWLRQRESHTWSLQFAKKCLRMEPEDRLRYIESLIAAEFMKELRALRDTEYNDTRLRRLERLSREFLRIQKHHTLELQSKLHQALTDSIRIPNPANPGKPSSI